MRTRNKCTRCLETTVWICLFECLFITLFKAVVALTSGSKAMLGSALYSLTDLVSSQLLIISLKVSSKPADAGHPYGHGKIEYIASVLISSIILIGTLCLIWVSMLSFYRIDLTPPHWIGIWASLACISLSHIVYRLVLCAAKQCNSPAAMSHAKHMRLDTLSSVAVIIAILAAEAGFEKVDAAIAILEAIHILIESTRMMLKSSGRLMDAAIDKEHVETVRAIVAQSPDVKGVSTVKGKYAGRGMILDVEIFLDSGMTIQRCNSTVRTIKQTLVERVPHLDFVHIHYRPYMG